MSLTGRALSLATLGGAWTLAMAVMGLLSGPIVDRFNRRSILAWLHVLLAILSLVVFVLVVTGHPRIWHFWAYLVGQAVFGVPTEMALESMLPDLARKGRLVRINGLLHSWGMTDNMIESALSGIVLAVWGPAQIFLFNSVMFLFGSAAAFAVPKSTGLVRCETMHEEWQPWADLRLTLRYIIRERLLRRYILLNQFGSLIFAPLFFMAPVVALAIGMGSEGYGFLHSLTLGGILGGSLLASTIGTKWPKVKMWIGGRLLYAIAFLALGLHVHPAIAFPAFFLFGFGCTGGRIYQSTLFQQILPAEHRGRVFGITGFVGGALQPPALALAMMFVDSSEVGVVLIGLSVMAILLAGVQLLLLPMREKDWVLSDPEGAPSSE
ncbi:MFS transporter [Candidatus Bipolaricaulota bacterium]